MPRRVHATALVLISLSLGHANSTAQAPTRLPPPNLLWILCEDSGIGLGCYGDKLAATANIDALAKTSVRYRQAFAHAPVPATSRSGIITGEYPSSAGSHHVPSRTLAPKHLKCFPELLRARGYFCTNQQALQYQLGPMQFSKDSPLDGWSPPAAWDAAGTELAHWRHRPQPQQRFFAVFSLGDAEVEPSHDPADTAVPPYLPDTKLVRRTIAAQYDRLRRFDQLVGEVLAELQAAGLAEDTIVWVSGTNGRDLPREKRWLYGAGTRIPLILHVPEKYRALVFGDRAAQRLPGSASDELVSSIDFAPTMLSLAGLRPPAWMRGRAFLGRRRQPPGEYLFAARDRIDEANDCVRSVYDGRFRYIRNHMPGQTYAQVCRGQDANPAMQELRRLHASGGLSELAARYFHTKPLEELYDTHADPFELHNLAAHPQQRQRLLAMREAQIDWSRRSKDLGLIPEVQFNRFKIQKFGVIQCQQPRFRMALGDRGRPAVQIVCQTADASVLYQIDGRGAAGPKHWNLYSEPVSLLQGQVLTAHGVGLGSTRSQLRSFKLGDKQSSEKDMAAEFRAPHWTRNLGFTDIQERLQKLKRVDFSGDAALANYHQLFRDRASDLRFWSLLGIHRLAQTPQDQAIVLPILVKALADSSDAISMAAARILAEHPDQREQALTAIRRLLHSPRQHAAFAALNTLDRCGDQIGSVKADVEALLQRIAATREKFGYLPPPLLTAEFLGRRIVSRAR